jgi:hypothetical protein
MHKVAMAKEVGTMSHDNEANEVKSPPAVAAPTEEVAHPQSATEPLATDTEQGKTVSPRKLAANRANAQRSTGPKTAEGKGKSKQNSYKHGFFARQPLPSGAEGDKLWEIYGELYSGIWEHYAPVGFMESLLTEKIATESIRFSRLLKYEGKYVGEKRAFHWDGIDRILRFQGAINRQLFQAIHELERLQEKRKCDANRSDVKPDKGTA